MVAVVSGSPKHCQPLTRLTVPADDGVVLSVPALEGVRLDVLSLQDLLPATGWCMSC